MQINTIPYRTLHFLAAPFNQNLMPILWTTWCEQKEKIKLEVILCCRESPYPLKANTILHKLLCNQYCHSISFLSWQGALCGFRLSRSFSIPLELLTWHGYDSLSVCFHLTKKSKRKEKLRFNTVWNSKVCSVPAISACVGGGRGWGLFIG